MRRIAAPLIPLALAATLLASSCAGSRARIIKLATNRPEFAGYAELFAHEWPDYKVEIVYAEDPRATLQVRERPDIVVGERLRCRDTLTRFDPLDDLFRRGGLRRSEFYPGSLELGVADGRQRTVPVSFNLPAVVFRETPALDLPNGMVLEVDDLRSGGADFNRMADGRYTRVGFSPLWSPAFLSTVVVLGGPAYDGSQDCRIAWRNPELTAGVELLRGWVADVNGGFAAQRAFAERYLYEPFTDMLQRDRIRFYYVASQELFDLSPSRLEGLGFRWLSVGDRVPVLTNIVSMGIPRDARHKAAARAFIRWFFSPETQATILADSSGGQIRGEAFGIAGGLSTLREVNERALLKYYPHLMGHIPTPELLRFPQPLPADWEDIRDALVLPWLAGVVERGAASGQTLAQEFTQVLRDGVEQLRRDR